PEEQQDERGTREGAPDGEAARFGRGNPDETERGRRGLREGDEYRVAGRVRLVLRDVELAHAQREVDRVEVFERRRQEREVRREEQEGERPAGQPDARSRCSMWHRCRARSRIEV